MSKEEGAGWTLAEMFSRKLLVEEVLGLGKRAGEQITVTVKRQKHEITEAAKVARKAWHGGQPRRMRTWQP